MLRYARGLEIAACPRQSSRIQGSGHRRHHGGLDVVIEKIVQWQQKNPASNGRGMIDDFRLWGSRRWSRTNAPPKKPRWRTGVARDFNHPNAFLSEGGPLAVVVESFPVASSGHRGLRHGRGRRERRGRWGGQGSAPAGRGFEGAGAPRQPQCITLGRLAPRH